MTIPLSSIRKVMKQAGATRISEEAVKEMQLDVEEFIASRTKAALVIMKNAGRNTLKAKDLRAVKLIV